MTEFTASNGVRVVLTNNGATLYSPGDSWPMPEPHQMFANADVVIGLREFFQHERDEELGRWRWPENPEYVVYLRNDGQACVFNEATGVTVYRFRGEHEHLEELRRQSGEEVMPHTHAARAYFEAHPERKPWDTASAGELWAFKTDPGTRETLWERDASESHWHLPGQTKAELGIHFTIVTGRKIWPEDAS